MVTKTSKNAKKTPSRMNGKETGVCFTSTNQPSPEAKSRGQRRYHDLKRLKQDLLADLLERDIPKNMMDQIKSKVESGEVKEAVDILKIIAPKDLNVSGDLEINLHFDKQDREL